MIILPPAQSSVIQSDASPRWRLSLTYRRFLEALLGRLPIVGVAEFAAQTTVSVTLSPELPSSNYVVSIDAGINQPLWVENKATDGFDIVTTPAHTGFVGWTLLRV